MVHNADTVLMYRARFIPLKLYLKYETFKIGIFEYLHTSKTSTVFPNAYPCTFECFLNDNGILFS